MKLFVVSAALALWASVGAALTLNSGNVEDNGLSGLMFDLETKSSALILEELDFGVSQGFSGQTSALSSYFRVGGAAGFENDASAWTLLSESCSIMLNNASNPAWLRLRPRPMATKERTKNSGSFSLRRSSGPAISAS